MAEYRRRTDGVIFNDDTLRNEYPSLSFPPTLTTNILNGLGFDTVVSAPPPSALPGQLVTRNGVTQVAGVWTYAWTVTTLPTSFQVTNPDMDQAAAALHSPNLTWFGPAGS